MARDLGRKISVEDLINQQAEKHRELEENQSGAKPNTDTNEDVFFTILHRTGKVNINGIKIQSYE